MSDDYMPIDPTDAARKADRLAFEREMEAGFIAAAQMRLRCLELAQAAFPCEPGKAVHEGAILTRAQFYASFVLDGHEIAFEGEKDGADHGGDLMAELGETLAVRGSAFGAAGG